MCGFAGFLDFQLTASQGELETTARNMADQLRHRGPDDAGAWGESASGIALGHRRLSIVDVSALGQQPMHSQDARWVIAYNGEIYNHAALRHELTQSGHTFRSSCDSEVLVEAIAHWGLEATLPRLNGMFAFAAWDRRERSLTLVRDRLGIKPLYYALGPRLILFGSELKSLRAHPRFSPSIHRDALALYVQHNYVPAPHTIYQEAYKLPPGCWVRWSHPHDGRASQPEAPTPTAYWALSEAISRGQRQPFSGDRHDAIATLQQLLQDSVSARVLADVPLGALLSGGIDSSTIVALMREAQTTTQTFSIGFDVAAYNEAPQAAAIAQHLGTDHTEQIVTSQEAREVIPELPRIFDEPFADSSQIPTILVSRLARQHVTVCLSGDGGDELFGGYQRYATARRLWKNIAWLPRSLRQVLARTVLAIVPPTEKRSWRRKLRSGATLLGPHDEAGMYHFFNRHWRHPESLVVGANPAVAPALASTHELARLQPVESFTYLDTIDYLPNDILTKVDRASMASGLEARTPLLDHQIVEFVWSLPATLRLEGQGSKSLLREVLTRHVPPALVDRPKVGFGVPLDSWLRGPLREWAEDLLSESRLREDGYFHAAPIRERWRQHVAGEADWHYHLWDILMFQTWLAHT